MTKLVDEENFIIAGGYNYSGITFRFEKFVG